MSNDVDFAAACEAIMQLPFPSFGDMLEMTIRNRVGNLVWKRESDIVKGTWSVKEALLGKQPSQYTTLLSHSELRDLRLRNNMDPVMNTENMLETMNAVRQSLMRLGYDILFAAIGVDVDIRKNRPDLGGHPNIVFVGVRR
jgi:hypothetical protein